MCSLRREEKYLPSDTHGELDAQYATYLEQTCGRQIPVALSSSAFDALKSAQDTTDAAASKEVNEKDEAKDLKDSSADGDSKHKKGFWAATL